MTRHGTAWHGTAWHGTAWHGTAWHSTAWHSTAWHGTAWHGTAWHSTAWHSTAWHGTAWHGTAWHSTAWHGTAWHSTAWHSTAWHGTAWHGTAWHSTAWHGTARHRQQPSTMQTYKLGSSLTGRLYATRIADAVPSRPRSRRKGAAPNFFFVTRLRDTYTNASARSLTGKLAWSRSQSTGRHIHARLLKGQSQLSISLELR